MLTGTFFFGTRSLLTVSSSMHGTVRASLWNCIRGCARLVGTSPGAAGGLCRSHPTSGLYEVVRRVRKGGEKGSWDAHCRTSPPTALRVPATPSFSSETVPRWPGPIAPTGTVRQTPVHPTTASHGDAAGLELAQSAEDPLAASSIRDPSSPTSAHQAPKADASWHLLHVFCLVSPALQSPGPGRRKAEAKRCKTPKAETHDNLFFEIWAVD